MSALENAEHAVDQLAPEEFEAFVRWFSERLAQQLGAKSSGTRLSAQELATIQEERIQNGSAKPFSGIDMSKWPEPAREKAKELISDWEASHE